MCYYNLSKQCTCDVSSAGCDQIGLISLGAKIASISVSVQPPYAALYNEALNVMVHRVTVSPGHWL